MGTEVIFWTQIASLVAYVATAFWLYKILADAKDATIKLLETRVTGLNSEIASLKERAPDALNERLASRGKLLEDQLRLQQDELRKAEVEQQELRDQVSKLEQKLKSGVGDRSSLVDQIVSTSAQLGKVNDRVDSLSDIWMRGLPATIDNDASSSSITLPVSDALDAPLRVRSQAPRLAEGPQIEIWKEPPPFGILRSFVKRRGYAFVSDADDDTIREEFAMLTSTPNVLAGGPSSYDMDAMKRFGWIDAEGFLTEAGVAQVRRVSMLTY